MPYDTNVFINCPFDDDYIDLFRPLLFTIIFLELEPKISLTKSSSHIRINQIKDHIQNSKFGIHDLSRCKPLKRKELPRFNMPYELGLDVGCCEFGGVQFKDKKILILETDRFQYQKVLSDIAGQDIKNHNDDPLTIIKKVRDWMSDLNEKKNLPNANIIWLAYNNFYNNLISNLLSTGYIEKEIEELPNGDFIKFAKDWIKNFKT